MNKLRNLLSSHLILWLSLSYSSLLYAQESSPQDIDTSLIPKQALKIKQIPTFSQRTNRLIQDTESLLEEQSVKNIEDTDLSETDQLVSQKLLLLGDTSKIYRIDRLSTEEQELNLLQERVTKWQEANVSLLEQALDKDTLIAQYMSVWELTLDSLTKKQAPNLDSLSPEEDATDQPTKPLASEKDTPQDLDTLESSQETEASRESIALIIESIQDYLENLNQIKQELAPVIARLQLQQANLTVILGKFEEMRSMIEIKRQEVVGEILIPEQPPIWAMSWDTNTGDINLFLYRYFEGDFLVLNSFLQNRPRFIYAAFFLLIIVFGLVLQLKFHAQSMAESFEEEIKEARIALRYPLLTSILVVWLVLGMLFHLPKEINKLFSLFMLLPVSFILWKLKPGWGYARIVIFIGMYLIFMVIPAMNNLISIQRITLLLVDVAGLGLLLWFRAQKAWVAQANTWFLGSLPLLIPIFIFTWAVAIVANVLGSVQLCQFLTIALLGTYLIFNVLRVVIELIRSLVFLILLGPVYRRSYILQEDAVLVLKKTTHFLKWFGLMVWLVSTLNLLTIRERFFQALYDFITHPIKIGDVSLSLGNILAFFVILQVSLWLSSLLRYLLSKEVYPRTKLKEGVPDTISIVIRYTLVFLGFTLALAGAGIKFSQLSLALGGLGVGIGFGLQNLVSNFISGIILVLERPMKIGDFVELQEISGFVQDIGLRASTIRTWDGSDVVVPNSEFVSQRLTNWTFKDKRRRLHTKVRVPFDTDMESITKLLLDTADEIPEVLKRPNPAINFSGIGESAMEITLYCWISDATNGIALGNIIRVRVYAALQKAGYEMPLPKQDIHLKTLPEKKSNQ